VPLAGFIGLVAFILEQTPALEATSRLIWKSPAGASAEEQETNAAQFEPLFEVSDDRLAARLLRS